MPRLLTVLVAAFVLAAPARAQLPILTPPAQAPPAPGAQTLALGGDAAHRNQWQGTGLRPPLELAWRTTAAPLVAPLAAGGRVFVETANALTAYNAADGTQLWQVGLPGPAEIATDGSRVFVASGSGLAALAAGTGAVQWRATGAATGPAVSGSLVVVGTPGGTLAGYNTASGTRIWNASVGIANARPAIAGQRVFASGRCGAAAVSAFTGLSIWRTGCGSDTGTRTLLAGLGVFSEEGSVYNAADGAVVFAGPGPGTIGPSLLFRSPLAAAATQLVAFDGTFSPRWTWTPLAGGRLALRPAAVDGAVWQLARSPRDGLVLAALDPASGAEAWSGFLGAPSVTPGVADAVSAAPGLLLVPTDAGLVALRNAPEGRLGAKATIPKNVYTAGARTRITGELVSNGHGLVGPREVVLEADAFPYGGYARAGRGISGPKGFSFPVRIARNTRFRFRADGVTYPQTTIYGAPTLSVIYARTSRPLVVRARLKVAAAGLKTGGVGVAVYRQRRNSSVLNRIGAGTARTDHTARFDVRIPLDLKRTDTILACIRRASGQGFGFPTVLDRRCGARRIEAQASASRLSLSTGTGSEIPLKRLLPALEKR